jgi:hypothetical protein
VTTPHRLDVDPAIPGLKCNGIIDFVGVVVLLDREAAAPERPQARMRP